MIDWIEVTPETMPPEFADIWALSKGGTVVLVIVGGGAMKGDWFLRGSGKAIDPNRFTRWQPAVIPAPPEVK